MLYRCVTVTHHYKSFITLQESRDVEGGGDHRAADAPTPEAGPAVKLRDRSNPAGLQCPVGGLLQVTLIAYQASTVCLTFPTFPRKLMTIVSPNSFGTILHYNLSKFSPINIR